MTEVKYSWKQCIRNYRFHSIFWKNLMLMFLLIILPFICLIGISYYAYRHIRQSEEKNFVEDLVTRVSLNVDSVFHEIRNKAIMLGVDSDVELFYLAESIEKDYFYDVQNILKLLALYNATTDVIDGVYVYAPCSNVVISEAGRYEYQNFVDRECIDNWEDDGPKFQLKYLKRKAGGKRKESIVFYYTAYYSGGQKGVAIINMSMEKLARVFSYRDDISLYIYGNNRLLYDSSMKQNGEFITEPEELQVYTEEAICVRTPLKESDLETIIFINREPLDSTLREIRIYMLTFGGIMLLSSVLFSFYISRKVFDPFREIIMALEDAPETGDRKLLQSKDEVGYIMNSIYSTVSAKKDLEKELLERIRLLKKTQAVALQSQINPHFINNTLEMINWMAVEKLGEGNDISEMLNLLSQLLRISLEDSDTFVTLKAEISYIQKYLYIQQKRLNNSFEVMYDIQKEVEDCKVIKMMLQPVVENALNHGIRPCSDRGYVTISAKRDGHCTLICVRDSGFGILPARVEEINASLSNKIIKESSHIGLSNVNQRIKLAFGDAYGIYVESKIGFGTNVCFILPFHV